MKNMQETREQDFIATKKQEGGKAAGTFVVCECVTFVVADALHHFLSGSSILLIFVNILLFPSVYFTLQIDS